MNGVETLTADFVREIDASDFVKTNKSYTMIRRNCSAGPNMVISPL
jgi:hypothetical protein